MTDFLPLWIRDCTPAVLAKKLLTACQFTGEKAEAGAECECPAHQLLVVEAAKAAAEALQVKVEQFADSHAELEKQYTSLLTDFQSVVNDLEAAKIIATEKTDIATRATAVLTALRNEARDERQVAATALTKVDDLTNRLAKAESLVLAFRTALKPLV